MIIMMILDSLSRWSNPNQRNRLTQLQRLKRCNTIPMQLAMLHTYTYIHTYIHYIQSFILSYHIKSDQIRSYEKYRITSHRIASQLIDPSQVKSSQVMHVMSCHVHISYDQLFICIIHSFIHSFIRLLPF
jgi:hypothetical protein